MYKIGRIWYNFIFDKLSKEMNKAIKERNWELANDILTKKKELIKKIAIYLPNDGKR